MFDLFSLLHSQQYHNIDDDLLEYNQAKNVADDALRNASSVLLDSGPTYCYNMGANSLEYNQLKYMAVDVFRNASSILLDSEPTNRLEMETNLLEYNQAKNIADDALRNASSVLLDSNLPNSNHDFDPTYVDPYNLDQSSLDTGISHQMLGDQLLDDHQSEMNNYHIQEGDYSCAVASQRNVIESITGIDLPEQQLAKFAEEHGWYDTASGTSPLAMGDILEAAGIPVENSFDLTVADIKAALANGEKVIVSLNANEIWNQAADSNGLPIEQAVAGHAAQVTGIYQNDDGHWYVILNDTGRGNGAGEMVALEDFNNAWSDFGNQAVITKLNEGVA
ncbi:MAG: hypothetical protein H6Q73_1144 [Firmicutes bacterium]|nr:hypothetical protein [Bacillota bacterium]